MIIYRILNIKNNKSYIGQSVHSFNIRYKGGKWWKYTHNEILKNAVNKYGIDSFTIEILKDDIENIEDLNKFESYYADMYNTYRPNGYNINGCGNNRFVDDVLKKQLSKARLGTDYQPKNKISSQYKGVYWKESKKSWLCRFHNNLLRKDKYASSEIEAAEIYDKVSLFLFGENCYINFEEKRYEYLKMDLKDFYENCFLQQKKKRNENYFKDHTELLEEIKPLIWSMSIPKIASLLSTTPKKVSYCIKKYNLETPPKNYWQKIKK